MSDITNQELKDLILASNAEMNARFVELTGSITLLNQKVDGVEKRLEEKIDGVEKHLEEKITRLDVKIDGVEKRLEEKISSVEQKLDEKMNGLEKKLDAQLDGLDKRLTNEEVISRGVFAAMILGILGGLTKFLFFPSDV